MSSRADGTEPAPTCTNPAHDHYDTDPAETPLQCPDCHQPAHWDEISGSYQHTDPTAADCFFTRRSEAAEPCDPPHPTAP